MTDASGKRILVADDWTRNWQASIAVKITAIVLWVMIVLVFVVAIFYAHGLETRLREAMAREADGIAHRVQQALLEGRSAESVLGKALDGSRFEGAVLLDRSAELLRLGRIGQGLSFIERTLLVRDGRGETVSRVLRLYHPSVDALAIMHRNNLVIGVFIGLLAFGLFLTWAIRVIVHRPLRQLVNASQAVSSGHHEVRMDTSRPDEFGQLSRFFNEMLDRLMAQQRELEEALTRAESASRAKSAFLANMSHELRTPLNAILGYSEMLLEDARAGKRDGFEEDLECIHAAGRHLLDLINDVLDLSKIEAGKMEVEPVMFDLEPLLVEVVDTVRPLMERQGNRLEQTISCDTRIFTDRIKLRQILVNILGNAAKFTERGTVTFRVESFREDGRTWCRFVVRDTGIGIPADRLPRLFDEFVQLDSSPSHRQGGTGLGLAISRRFAHMLGGEIRVSSEPGKGSEFTLVIPADYAETQRQAGHRGRPVPRDRPALEGAAAADDGEASRPRVLVVDDNPAIAEMIRRTLEPAGVTLQEASQGAEVFDIVGDTPPDAALIDIVLPQCSGFEVAAALRERWPGVSIAIMSAMEPEAGDREMLQSLDAEFIPKGIDLRSRVREFVERTLERSERENDGHAAAG